MSGEVAEAGSQRQEERAEDDKRASNSSVLRQARRKESRLKSIPREQSVMLSCLFIVSEVTQASAPFRTRQDA